MAQSSNGSVISEFVVTMEISKVPCHTLPDSEIDFLTALSIFGQELLIYSSTLAVPVGTQKAVSLMLYQRLWSNFRAFGKLWSEDCFLEANIIIRTAIEAAICIAANKKLGGGFYPLLLGDLAATLKKMIKLWRSTGETDLVSLYEAQLRNPPAGTPAQPKAFVWKELAGFAEQPILYDRHRWLSATSAHVTGISLLRSVVTDGDTENLQAELLNIDQTINPLCMGCVFMFGARLHAQIVGNDELTVAAERLDGRLKELLETAQGNG